MDQITNTIVMIKPAHFGFNQETAATNTFQKSFTKAVEIIKSGNSLPIEKPYSN